MVSSELTDSMSTCRCASRSRAVRSSRPRRRAASSRPTAGASGRMCGVNAVTFTDTFTRGIGPIRSLSSTARSGHPAAAAARLLQHLAAAPAYRSASSSVTVASPSRSTELAIPERQSPPIGLSAARGDSPTTKRCAMWRTPALPPSALRPAREPAMRVAASRGVERSSTSSR